MAEEEFKDALVVYLQKSPFNTYHLAAQCEIAVKVINSWVRGDSCPSPRVREWIISWM